MAGPLVFSKKGTDQQFPKFETYREQIDGKYWFPTYTIANSTLHFKDASPRIRLSVKYEDYKQFKSDTKIIFGSEVDKTPAPKIRKALMFRSGFKTDHTAQEGGKPDQFVVKWQIAPLWRIDPFSAGAD